MTSCGSSMCNFYEAYYRALRTSRAHAEFCARAYGRDLGQHGFMDMAQLDALLCAARLTAGSRVLDLGCGNGRIDAAIAEATGARVTGVDAIAEAIRQAHDLPASRTTPLAFVVGDLRRPGFRPGSFDVLLSIDSLYFSDDYPDTLREWSRLLAPGGRMLIFSRYGVDPEHPEETFAVETLPAGRTPLGETLGGLGCRFAARDFTAGDVALAERKIEALLGLRSEFVAEGHEFLYDNRLGEARGVKHAAEIGMHARYLYEVACGA